MDFVKVEKVEMKDAKGIQFKMYIDKSPCVTSLLLHTKGNLKKIKYASIHLGFTSGNTDS
jgi:hypothetical protein